MYGVAGFLEDFIASVEKQTFPLERVQVVMVDDGSVDGSLDIVKAWAKRRPELVTVVTQENAGQSVARNVGLEHATGEWVSFPDPDDAISEEYLENVDRFIEEHAETDLVATNRWLWNDDTGEVTNSHPLRYMFQRDRLVDLVRRRPPLPGQRSCGVLPTRPDRARGPPLRRPHQARLRGRHTSRSATC